MFTDMTYQDYLVAEDKGSLLLRAVERYRRSGDFTRALEAAENLLQKIENPEFDANYKFQLDLAERDSVRTLR